MTKHRASSTVSLSSSRDDLERLAEIASDHVRNISSLLYMHDHGIPISSKDYSDLPIVRERLNAKERSLFDENPIVGARVLLHALTATDTAKDLYQEAVPIQHNGNGDAYRHMYWNFLMARYENVGPSWAERWGNAHEDGDEIQPSLERLMDLHNNLRGRQLAVANVDDDPRALRSGIRNGSCRIIEGGSLVRSNSDGEKA